MPVISIAPIASEQQKKYTAMNGYAKKNALRRSKLHSFRHFGHSMTEPDLTHPYLAHVFCPEVAPRIAIPLRLRV
jgi:hypothetical protein